MSKILIIYGPNLNLLGEREQSQYGKKDYKSLEEICLNKAKELKIKNHNACNRGKLFRKVWKVNMLVTLFRITCLSLALFFMLDMLFLSGSKVFVEKGGYFLNNEMDDFSAQPGVPNQFGLLGAEANAIQPMKRMLSSMTPTLVTRDGAPFLITGSPGGSTIITTVLQVIMNVIDHGMSLAGFESCQ